MRLLLYALFFAALSPAVNVSAETSARPVRSEPTNRRHRSRFDRDAAFERYVTGWPDVSFASLSREFHVSTVTIRKWARIERWVERAEEIRKKAAEKNALRTLEERNRRTLQVVEKARDHLLSDEAKHPLFSDLPGLVKLEQLIEGEATSRCEVRQVSLLLVELGSAAVGLLDNILAEAVGTNGARRQILGRFQDGWSELLERSASGLSAIGGGSE